MENKEIQELLHNIDKRLAILEVIQKEHVNHIEEQIDKMERQLDKLRIKVAGIATGIVVVAEVAAKYFGK